MKYFDQFRVSSACLFFSPDILAVNLSTIWNWFMGKPDKNSPKGSSSSTGTPISTPYFTGGNKVEPTPARSTDLGAKASLAKLSGFKPINNLDGKSKTKLNPTNKASKSKHGSEFVGMLSFLMRKTNSLAQEKTRKERNLRKKLFQFNST